jgi:hypothetical protein
MSTEICLSSYGPGDFSIAALSIGVPSGTGSTFTVTTDFPATRLLGFDVYAYSVQVRFQSTDTFGSSTTSLPTVSHTALVPVPHPMPLPPGAKAGIGVGAAILILGIIAGALFCLRRRQQHRKLNPETADSNIHGLFLKPELEAGTQSQEPKVKQPFDVAGISELDTSSPQIPELDPSNPIPKRSAIVPQQPAVGELNVVATKASEQPMDASVVRKPLAVGPATFPDITKDLISSPESHPRPQESSSRAEQKAPEVPETKEGTEDGDESADSLQEEIERIREERERLSRLIELGKMEEKLRQQMAEQKALKGS